MPVTAANLKPRERAEVSTLSAGVHLIRHNGEGLPFLLAARLIDAAGAEADTHKACCPLFRRHERMHSAGVQPVAVGHDGGDAAREIEGGVPSLDRLAARHEGKAPDVAGQISQSVLKRGLDRLAVPERRVVDGDAQVEVAAPLVQRASFDGIAGTLRRRRRQADRSGSDSSQRRSNSQALRYRARLPRR